MVAAPFPDDWLDTDEQADLDQVLSPDPAPMDTTPAAVNPAPVNPAPVNPALVNPAQVNPAPVYPVPGNLAPVNLAPVNLAPVNPAPVAPQPPDVMKLRYGRRVVKHFHGLFSRFASFLILQRFLVSAQHRMCEIADFVFRTFCFLNFSCKCFL